MATSKGVLVKRFDELKRESGTGTGNNNSTSKLYYLLTLLAHGLFDRIDSEGFMTYTAGYHWGMGTEMFLLHLRMFHIVHLYIQLIYSTSC